MILEIGLVLWTLAIAKKISEPDPKQKEVKKESSSMGSSGSFTGSMFCSHCGSTKHNSINCPVAFHPFLLPNDGSVAIDDWHLKKIVMDREELHRRDAAHLMGLDNRRY